MKSRLLPIILMLVLFTYQDISAQCFVGSFSPLTGACTGKTVDINGSFALTGSTTPRVTWGGTVCQIQSYSLTKIVITLPTGASGNSVTVRDKANCTASGTYPGIVYQTPAPPTSLTTILTTINQGQSTTIFVNGGSAGQTKWYTGGCGVGNVFSTNPVAENVSPSVTTTYYVRNESLIGNCPSSCVSVTITVIPGGGGGGNNSITTGNSLSGSHLYNGCNFSVPYTATGSFNSNNVFSVQLSDPIGSFASPVVIGSQASTALSGSISATIPTNAMPGTGYRVRVVSNDPAVIGSDNGSNLSIGATTIGLLPTGTLCPNSTFNLPFTASPCITYLPGNVFTAQLSDAFGNFSNPTVVGTLSSTASSGVISVTLPGGIASGSQYRIRVISSSPAANGLQSATSINIASNQVATITPNGPTVLCGSGSVLLTATSGLSYMWSDNSTSQSVQVSQTGTYTVTVSFGNNCSAVSSPLTVSLNPVPSIPTASSNSPVKLGATIQLNTNLVANASYHWRGPNNFSSNQINPSLSNATVPMAGVYTLTDTVNGCGSLPVSLTVELYGEVVGKIKTETNVGIKTTTVEATAIGIPNQSHLTNPTGNYNLNLSAGLLFTITPAKANDRVLTNGITVADYQAVRAHIRGNRLLSSPYKIIAADVSGDQVVNNVDLNLINRMINNQFGFLGISRLWSFVPHDYVFPNPQNPFPFPSSRTHTITSNYSSQDFIGMKMGDVNNSWNPSRAIGDTLEFNIPHLTASKDSDIMVPVRAKNFRSISAFQFTMQWDPAVLAYVAVDTTSGALKVQYGDDSTATGKLVVSWIDEVDSATTLADNTTLFYIRYNAIGNNYSSTPVQINSEISTVEAIDSLYDYVDIKVTDGQVTIQPNSPVEVNETDNNLFPAKVYPNPFGDQANLILELRKSEEVLVEFFDLTGRLIYREQKLLGTGRNIVPIGHPLSHGTYLMHLYSGEFSKTFRLTKLSK